MSIDSLFQKLDSYFKNYRLHSKFILPEKEIYEIFYTLQKLSVSRNAANSKIRNQLFSLIYEYEDVSYLLLIAMAFDQIELISNKYNVKKIDDDNFSDYSFDEINIEFEKIMKEYLSKHNKIRLLERQNDKLNISINKANEIFSYIIDSIQIFSIKKINQDDTYISILCMINIAGILNKMIHKDRWPFYKLCNLTIQILNKNELFQESRNLCEEIFLLSIEENTIIYGSYVQSYCYARQKNIIDTLYYFLLTCRLIDNEKQYNDIWLECLKQIQIVFRDSRIHDWQNRIFLLINSLYREKLSNRDILQINLTNIASEFSTGELNISSLEVFLNGNRELILSENEESIFTWYILILQICERIESKTLTEYSNYFERCLDKDSIENAHQLLGNTQDLKSRYNEIYRRIERTMYHRDMVSEIQNLKLFITKMVDRSIKDNNIDYFINAFRLKCDLSQSNFEKPKEGIIANEYNSEKSSIDYFSEFSNRFKTLEVKGYEYIFLTGNKEKLVYLNWDSKSKNFPKISSSWDYKKMKTTMNNLFQLMRFNPNMTDYDYKKEYNEYTLQKKCLSDFEIDINTHNSIGVFPDIDFAIFPINLIKSNGDFIFLKKPMYSVYNFNSIYGNEISNINSENISLWCPIDSGDLTLNMLYSFIEEYISKYNIIANCNIDIDKTFNGNIRIIIAHGGEDISNKGTISATNNFDGIKYSYEHIENVLIDSDIVILFVCYSGKVDLDFFYERNNSLIKKILNNGTKVVIAPKWPLNIYIPPIWLPIFIDCFRAGDSSLDSFHKANLQVFKKYPNCGAWACLHYYGSTEVFAKSI